MNRCTNCGAENAEGSHFCGSCGLAFTAPATAPLSGAGPQVSPSSPLPPPPPAAPPAQARPILPPAGEPVGNAMPSIDWRRVLTGNWLGAGLTAVVALGAAAVVSALVAFLSADHFDLKSAIGLTALLTEASFGADVVSGAGAVTTSVGQYPLLATFVALGAAALVFRRVIRAYPDMPSALGDAVRASLILAVLLTLGAVVTNIVEPDLRGYTSDDDSLASAGSLTDYLASSGAKAGLGDFSGKSQTSVAGAIFLGFLLLLMTLVLVAVARRATLDGVWLKVHEWLAAPVAGLAAIAVGLCVAGLVYIAAVLVGHDDARDFTNIVGMIAVLPALGMRVVGLGLGAPWGASTDYKKEHEEAMSHIGGFADDHGGLFWISIPVALALAGLAVWTVVRQSADRRAVLRNVLVYLGLLVVAVPLLVRVSNFHLSYGRRKDVATFFLGLGGAQTTALFILASAVIGAVVLLATGGIDVDALRARAGTLQRNPASGPHPGSSVPPPPPPSSQAPPAPPSAPTEPPGTRPRE